MIKKIKIKKIFGGKGELSNFRFVGEAIAMKNILRNKRTQIFLALLIIFTLQTQVFTHLAFARSSGGGDLGGFDVGKFVVSTGIGLASTFVGAAIADGISASYNEYNFFTGGGKIDLTTGLKEYGGFNGGISSVGNLGDWASNYSSMLALSEVGAAVNTVGRQQDWDVSQTVLVSSMVTGAVGGGLNPSGTLGVRAASNSTIKAMTVGTISGGAEGMILANNVDSKGRIKPWVNAAAGVTGSFAGGVVASSIAPVVPSKAGSYKDYVASGGMTKDKQSFGPVNQGWYKKNVLAPTKANTSGQALTHGAVKAFSAIPSELIGMGVSRITKDMDKQDAFMARQAFGGVYHIAGAVYKYKVRDPVLKKFKLDHYIGTDGLSGKPLQKIGNPID